MLIFQKYLLRHLISSCFSVTAVLVSIVWITQTLRFIETVFRKVDTDAFFILMKLSLYMLPNLVVVLLPVGFGIGCLFTLYKLLEDREIIAFWAGGVQGKSILNLVVGMASVLCIFSFFLQAYVSPLFMNKFRQLDRSVRHNVTLSFIEENAFQDFGNITLYVRKKRKNNLFNILAYVTPEKSNPYTVIAQKGAVLADENVPKLVLEDGVRQERKPIDGGKVSVLNFDRSIVEITSLSKEDNDGHKKPSEYFLWELFFIDSKILKNKMLAKKLKAEIHLRFISPYLAFLLPILVSFLLLRGGFQRRGYIKRSIFAMTSVLAVQAFSLIAANSHALFIQLLVYFILVSITMYIFFRVYIVKEGA